uniref:Uncharacterized protein n=1 Tax=Arundo donax TaxID=35708 RepID=A0A0A9FU08_ARUDO
MKANIQTATSILVLVTPLPLVNNYL